MRGLALLVLIALSISCAGPNKQATVKDNLKVASQLIDGQRTDEALTFLEDLLEKDPSNREYRLALASAYAHAAGFKIQNFVPILNSLQKFKEDLGPVHPTEGKDKNLDALVQLGQRLSHVALLFSQIPEVDPKKEYLLKEGIRQIDKIQNKSQTENAYQGLLRIVLIKTEISHDLFVLDPSATNCRVRFDVASTVLDRLGKDFAALFENLEAAQPQNAKELRDWKMKLLSLTSDASLYFAGAEALDEASKLYLNTALIQEGVANLAQCHVGKN